MIETDEKVSVSKAMRILEIFRDMDAEMPIGQCMGLLQIAAGETKDGGGVSVTELGKLGNFSLNTASRYVRALGKKDRHGQPGLELVTDPRDPLDDRRKVLRLTPKGRRVITRLHDTLKG